MQAAHLTTSMHIVKIQRRSSVISLLKSSPLSIAARNPATAIYRHRRSILTVKTQQEQQTSAATASTDDETPPPGCSRYSVTLRKPLGLVLEEGKQPNTIVVADILVGSNAEKSGVISVGDALIATTGYTRTTEQAYGEVTVRGGEQIVRVMVRNESFDTIMAAIGSHPGNIPVVLEFQQCE